MDLVGFGIMIPLLPLYAERFGATPLTIGILFAVYSLAQLIMSPLWGRLSDRIGRRSVLLVTIAGSAIGSLMLGLAGSLIGLFLGRILDGASGASVAVARATVADLASPENRPRLMGLLGAAFGLGFVVGPAIGGLAALVGPSAPFFVAATISALNFIVAWFRLVETKPFDQDVVKESKVRQVGFDAWRLIALTFVGVTAFSAFEVTFALLGDARLGLTESTIAWLFAGVGLVLVLTQVGLIGPVSEKFGEIGAIRFGLLLNALGFTLLALSGGWSGLLSGLSVIAVGQGLIMPNLSSAVSSVVAPRNVGFLLGIQQSAGGLARVVGPVIGGALFAAAIEAPYLFAAAMSLGAVLLAPRLRHVRWAAV